LRALVIVLDSVGIGSAPDAADYGDVGADTLGHLLDFGLRLPNLWSLGLGRAVGRGPECEVRGRYGTMTERSRGKDSTTGHWELMGAVQEEPFATFDRFPRELVEEIERQADVSFIGNRAASGTAIIDELGPEHLLSGKLILYTSADSVLQIAAHEGRVPPGRLYEVCQVARNAADRYRIGRVIARPFVGEPGKFERTGNRHDFSMRPPRTVLDGLLEAGVRTVGVGKVGDLFAEQGLIESHPTPGNSEGMQKASELWDSAEGAFLLVNLVDFDTLYGHRRDPAGYAHALTHFDAWLGGFVARCRPGDLVVITADHGNDPTFRGTDHTRERVPLLVWQPMGAETLGNRDGFADVGASVAEYFGVRWPAGLSFLTAVEGLDTSRAGAESAWEAARPGRARSARRV
jgi:phosphopentomutase